MSQGPDSKDSLLPSTLPEYELPSFAELELRIESYGMTDVGKVRKANEDQFLVGTLKNALVIEHTSLAQSHLQLGHRHLGHLFIVADGVGGSVGGRHASAMAIDTIEEFLVSAIDTCNRVDVKDGEIFRGLKQALEMADSRVIQESSARPELTGMGTTTTLAFCRNHEMFLAHVGDSRCYRLRSGQFDLLTQDHTVAGEMARQGILKQEEVEAHPLNNVITNVVGGTEAGTAVELSKQEMLPGDVVLFCTDGLTKMMKDAEMAQILQEENSAKGACERLISLANERGGKDNVTVIVARFLVAGASN